MTERLCKTCNWLVARMDERGMVYDDICGHPELRSPVDGQPHRPCDLARLASRECGPDGRLWAPREEER